MNRQVADIESRRVGKRIDGGFRGLLSVVVSIASALILIIGEYVLYELAGEKTQWMLAMLNVLC